MARDRKKLQHIHSSVLDKQPTPATLEVGEIAVNNAENGEFLSIKNTNDKVVRFSSDEQIVTIMEKKEVMPYEGMVRGEVGPDGTKDGKGSYGITNDDLLNNKSNIVIKLNQVAASNTTKHDKVNGSKDIYNKLVNPTEDSGLNDGAGFAIDMSRYAMIDANPSFSSLTVTDKTDLSGNTTISNGDGTGTRTGHTLNIQTTDVAANDTNWTETITNKTSKITTLDESATTRTTVIGTETLTVSGTTTETHKGNVIIDNKADVNETTDGSFTELIKTNSYRDVNGNYSGTTGGTTTEVKVGNVTESHSGLTTENNSGAVVVNNLSTKIENTTGALTENNSSNYNINTIGKTTVVSTGSTTIETNGVNNKVTIQSIGEGGDVEISANDTLCESAGTTAAFVGATKTNIGKNCSDNGQTSTLNINGATINETGNTVNISATTNVNVSANTVCVSGGTAANVYAPTTNVGASCAGSTATTVNVNGTTINEGGTTINETFTNGNLNITNYDLNGSNICISGSTKANLYGATTNIGVDCNGSTTAATINVSGTTINEGGTTINENATNYNGAITNYNLSTTNYTLTGNTINEYGNTVNISGKTTNITGDTNLNMTGADVCIYGTNEASLGAATVNVGTNCDSTTVSNNINIKSNNNINVTSVNENHTATTINSTSTNYNVTANTETHTTTSFTLNTTDVCLNASSAATVGGDISTNIGANCAGTPISNTTNIYGDTINNSGATINSSATTINNTATTINNSATTINNTATTYNVTATSHFNGDVYIDNSKKLYLTPDCTSDLTSTTVNAALCEVMDRSEVTFKVGDYAATDENLKWYELWQNGKQLKDQNGNTVRIDIPKDHILKDVSIVNGHASGSSFTACTAGDKTCEWYIKLVWNVFNPSTGHSDDKTVYLPANNLVQDHSFDDTSAINFTTDYDGQKIHVSADTTVQIVTDGNGTKTFSKSNAVHSLNSYKLTTAAGEFTAKEFDPLKESVSINVPTAISHLPSRGKLTVKHNGLNDTFDPASDKSVTLPHSALTIEYGVDVTSKTNDSYNTSAGKTVSVPTAVSHISRGTLSYSHNGFSGTFDPASNATFTSPHSSLTATYEATSGKSGSVKFDTAADKSISIPTAVNHLNRGKLTLQKNSTTIDTFDPASDKAINITVPTSTDDITNNLKYLKWSLGTPSADTTGYNGSTEKTITIPSSIDHLDEWNGTCFTIPHNLCVNGTITADGSIYSTSDERKKQDIQHIALDDKLKVRNIPLKSFAFKDDPQRKVYGVIAQEVEAAGLNELIHTDERGMLSVDYTSFLILRIAYLEKLLGHMHTKIAQLEEKINKK